MSPKVKQLIHIGSHRIELPEGVTALDWALERVNFQNPRIRAFLGCIRVIEGVLESNYALLHCSPERLLDIWSKVRQVTGLIRTRIAPLLDVPSRIPRLEEARLSAGTALAFLDDQVLSSLDRFPAEVPQIQLLELRKALCVSIGQIHSFLHDTFGEIMASDPRSLHDADYFISRRFPRDIEEAEWLQATLLKLQEYLASLEEERPRRLAALADSIRREETVPQRPMWEGTRVFLEGLLSGFVPKLKEVLALRGVRFYEMEILDRYTYDIPARCRMLLELYETASDAIEGIRASAGITRAEREQGVRDLIHCHAAFARRMAVQMGEIDKALLDLVAFIPLWLEAIEKRRALLLRRSAEAEEAGP
ncbi:MAG TPA: hypothetical protein VE685_23215 [Thermoanaerobaculia bacterium]|nr:hypothetical protein [Thermoanaerobaculia bacterium]